MKLAETPKVQGFKHPPLVTPTSQMVGVQAVTNATGRWYKRPNEIRAYCRGEYGRTPAPIDKDVLATILDEEQPFGHADSLSRFLRKQK